MCRGHPLVGVDWFIQEKRRSLYLLPSYKQRLLALPYSCRTATQKPTLNMCNQRFRPIFLSKFRVGNGNIYISTGIYRCSILDMNMKFFENFCLSRISADKRFLIYVFASRPLTPDRGFCKAVCAAKLVN